jgi:hypothetical protein
VRVSARAATEQVSVLIFAVYMHVITNVLVAIQLENCRQFGVIWWDPLPVSVSTGILGAVVG